MWRMKKRNKDRNRNRNNRNSRSKICSAVLTACTAAAVVSGAIAAPILIRSFYYAHIGPLELTERCGMTEEQIKEAYDDVMDYCLGKSDDFSAGDLTWSEEGRAHFADVRTLFILDILLLMLSLAAIAAVIVYCIFRGRRPYFFKGHSPGFWAGVCVFGASAAVAAVAALNFDKAFEIFHRLFFPGKDNWLFDPYHDPMILMLPQEFFRNCAVMIAAVILILCVALIAADYGILYKDRRLSGSDVYQK